MNTITSRLPSLYGPFKLLGESRHFTLFWLGQSLSEIGNRLTGFGLGIWVYQNTHAVTQLSLVLFFTTLPGVLLTPFVGALVDRWNRQWVILVSDVAAALVTFVLALLLLNYNLHIWHTYVCALFTSVCGSFQMTAKGAALPMLVPKHQVGRANGLIQFSTATGQIAAPALAGLLIVYLHLGGLLWIDLSTYIIAFVTLLLIRIPQPDRIPRSSKDNHSIIDDIIYGWERISSQLFLIVLLVLMNLHFFVSGMTNVLINPLVLSFSSEATFGGIMSVGGAGMVVGSIAMSIWGGATKRIAALLGFSALNGMGLVITGIKPSIPLIALGVFLSFLSLPLILGTNQTIWQTSIHPNVQGRVLSIVGMMTGLAMAFGNISASPLADRVLEPMLSTGGVLANSVGRLLETGHGRGIGFLIVMEGLLVLLASASLYNYYHHFRHLDGELVAVGREKERQTLDHLPQSSRQDEFILVQASEDHQVLDLLQLNQWVAEPSGALQIREIPDVDSVSDKIRFSLVIPTYNESANIANLIKKLSFVLDSVIAEEYELIIVDDDSPDGTWEIAQSLTTEYPQLRVMRRTTERDLSSAVVRGWQVASGEILGVIDGDLQHPPTALLQMLLALDEGADLVVASRYIGDGGVSNWHIVRRSLSRGAQLLGLMILPGVLSRFSDPMSGYFIVRRAVIANKILNPVGYKILLEVIARGEVRQVSEVGYVFQERQQGETKVTFRHYVNYLHHLLRLRLTKVHQEQK